MMDKKNISNDEIALYDILDFIEDHIIDIIGNIERKNITRASYVLGKLAFFIEDCLSPFHKENNNGSVD